MEESAMLCITSHTPAKASLLTAVWFFWSGDGSYFFFFNKKRRCQKTFLCACVDHTFWIKADVVCLWLLCILFTRVFLRRTIGVRWRTTSSLVPKARTQMMKRCPVAHTSSSRLRVVDALAPLQTKHNEEFTYIITVHCVWGWRCILQYESEGWQMIGNHGYPSLFVPLN